MNNTDFLLMCGAAFSEEAKYGFILFEEGRLTGNSFNLFLNNQLPELP